MTGRNPGKTSKSVPDWVSQQYYRIGLLCASRPRPVLFVAVLTVIYACWPLLSVPIYIGRPATFVETLDTKGLIVSKPNSSSGDDPIKPIWMSVDTEPVAYVQQIIVKAMVHPYRKEELIKTGRNLLFITNRFYLEVTSCSSTIWHFDAFLEFYYM